MIRYNTARARQTVRRFKKYKVVAPPKPTMMRGAFKRALDKP